MNPKDISLAKDKDLPGSLIAIHRAAYAARQEAVRTNTAIAVMTDGKIVWITADELRAQGVR